MAVATLELNSQLSYVLASVVYLAFTVKHKVIFLWLSMLWECHWLINGSLFNFLWKDSHYGFQEYVNQIQYSLKKKQNMYYTMVNYPWK